MSAANCITHHYACDCREAATANRIASLERVIAEAVALLPEGSLRSKLLAAIPGVKVPHYKQLLCGAPKSGAGTSLE